MRVVASRNYERRATRLLSAAERSRAEAEIIAAPAVWPVVPGTGGARKARIGLQGRGKRGGGPRDLFLQQRARISRAIGHLRQGDERGFDACRQGGHPGGHPGNPHGPRREPRSVGGSLVPHERSLRICVAKDSRCPAMRLSCPRRWIWRRCAGGSHCRNPPSLGASASTSAPSRHGSRADADRIAPPAFFSR